MRRLNVILVLAGFLVLAATPANADSFLGFPFAGGTLTATLGGGVTNSPGSGLTGYISSSGTFFSGAFGTISFTTGDPMASGSLGAGGTFPAGGSVTITTNAAFQAITGVTPGVFFSGTFSGPVSWILSGCTAGATATTGTCTYSLTGPLSGTLSSGFAVLGGSTIFTININTDKGFFDPGDTATIASGEADLVVPEPGTMALFGTGLLGLAGLVRRRLAL